MVNIKKNVRFKTIFVSMLLFTFSLSHAFAADNYDNLSLNDAVDIALKNNVSQRISLQAAAIAESQYQEAMSAHWPTVSF